VGGNDPIGEKADCQARKAEIIIEIAAQGEGIPPEKEAEIFRPFVTNKREGTGLHLTIVRKIIEAHNGSILIDKNTTRGTVFRLAIPMRRSGSGKSITEMIRRKNNP